MESRRTIEIYAEFISANVHFFPSISNSLTSDNNKSSEIFHKRQNDSQILKVSVCATFESSPVSFMLQISFNSTLLLVVSFTKAEIILLSFLIAKLVSKSKLHKFESASKKTMKNSYLNALISK